VEKRGQLYKGWLKRLGHGPLLVENLPLILQSCVAIHLTSGGIFSDDLVTNLLQNVMVEEFWKSVAVWQSCWQEFGATFFGLVFSSDAEINDNRSIVKI